MPSIYVLETFKWSLALSIILLVPMRSPTTPSTPYLPHSPQLPSMGWSETFPVQNELWDVCVVLCCVLVN